MANYSLVINSKFRPFEYQELLAPVLMATQAHQALEEAYSNLDTEAAVLDSRTVDSPKAHSLYTKFSRDLASAAETLSKHGLTPQLRRTMLDMRSRYGREMAPINAAWERRRELAKEQRALRGTDTSIKFDNDYSTMSLDALMSNPEMSYTSISGNKDVAAVTADMAEQVARSILSDPTYRDVLNSQYFQQRQQAGVPLEEVLTEIADAGGKQENTKIHQALRTIRNTVHSQLSSNPAYDKSWVDSYINRGLYHAIGTAKYDLVKNGEYIDAASRRQLAQSGERIALAKKEFYANYEPDGNGGFRKKTPPIRIPTIDEMLPVQGGGYLDPSTGIIMNENGEVVLPAKDGASNELAKGNGTLPFTMIDYTGYGFNTPGSTDEFSIKDAKLYPKEKLTPAQRRKLTKDLLPYGLTIDDVYVYRDRDLFSANHYRIVPKGANAYGSVSNSLDFN